LPQKKQPLPFVPLESMIARAEAYARHDLRISAHATGGYVLALQMNEFFRPELAYSSFPRAWFEQYSAMDLLLADPVLEWAAVNSGAARWSEIAAETSEPRSIAVLDFAASFNLRFGVILSAKNQMIGLKRSFLSCARPDREFTDEEIADLDATFQELLSLRSLTAKLTRASFEAMRLYALGMSQIEIAFHLGISRETVKKRLERARATLGARNAAHALAMAVEGSIVSAYA
jgi:LuxR family transcriptional regulator